MGVKHASQRRYIAGFFFWIKYDMTVLMNIKNIENQKRWILQEKYNGRMTTAAQKDIQRLMKGEPVDYIIGWVEFLGCTIDLSQKPLIPRLETEFWTEKVIEDLQKKKQVRVLDMFAGSGAIGISIMRHVKHAKVVFVDSEKHTIDQIKINCKLNKIPPAQYEIIQSDIFKNLKGKFDVIVANPPYIPTKNKHKVQASALQHEPHTALFGGGDGLFFIDKFLGQAKNFLARDGVIYMEFDTPQKPAIAKLLKKYGYQHGEFYKDQFNTWRWVKILIR